MKKFAFMCAISALFSTSLMAEPYIVDAGHSSVGFSVKHLSISNVKGSLDKFSGTLDIEGKTIKALEGEAQVLSINTNDKARDKHLNAI